MSIMIKGAKMPKDCFECPLYNFDHVCVILERQNLAFDKPPDCPLVEIPPHGRLIDADKLKDKINIAFLSEIGKVIDDAPTVIESEEEYVASNK